MTSELLFWPDRRGAAIDVASTASTVPLEPDAADEVLLLDGGGLVGPRALLRHAGGRAEIEPCDAHAGKGQGCGEDAGFHHGSVGLIGPVKYANQTVRTPIWLGV